MYWLVSLPLVEQSQDRTWSLLQEKTCYQNSLSENFKFELPGLRVGTLDSLLALSDDLVKTNISIEGVVNKIRRQLHEMTDGSSETSLSVGGAPVESFLTSFQWDEAKYPSRKPLKELVDSIAENVARIEDDLKTKVAEYNNIRGIVSAATRKAQGSLAARDLSTIVEAKHVVETENLTTIFVIIPKYGLRDWEQQYPKLHQFVVPRSSAVLAEDTEYALVTLVLFKRVLDTVKQELRQKGLQVREYVISEDQQEDTGTKAEAMKADLAQKRAALEEWCDTSYGEVFGAWVHISGIRLFVESILRYGLPPSFQSGLLKPQRKMEGKLRGVLAQTFGPASSSLWNQDAGGTAGATGLGGEADMYPYVSFTIDVDA